MRAMSGIDIGRGQLPIQLGVRRLEPFQLGADGVGFVDAPELPQARQQRALDERELTLANRLLYIMNGLFVVAEVVLREREMAKERADLRIVGRQPDRAKKRVRRFREMTDVDADQSEREISECKLGAEIDRMLNFGEGALVLAPRNADPEQDV